MEREEDEAPRRVTQRMTAANAAADAVADAVANVQGIAAVGCDDNSNRNIKIQFQDTKASPSAITPSGASAQQQDSTPRVPARVGAPTQTRVRNPLADHVDVVSNVVEFARNSGYLFVAGVSKHFKAAWGDTPRTTSFDDMLQSPSHAAMLTETECDRYENKICPTAAAGGHLETIKWARRKGLGWGIRTATTDRAAKGGYLELFQWCVANGCPWKYGACDLAASGGHLELVRWCTSKGCPLADTTCAGAAAGGHLDVLKWCRARNCKWDGATCAQAARGGHLGVLQWCIQQGCPVNQDTALEAARGGRVDMLKLCKANECPITEEASHVAAENGHLEVRRTARNGKTRRGGKNRNAFLFVRGKSAHVDTHRYQ